MDKKLGALQNYLNAGTLNPLVGQTLSFRYMPLNGWGWTQATVIPQGATRGQKLRKSIVPSSNSSDLTNLFYKGPV